MPELYVLLIVMIGGSLAARLIKRYSGESKQPVAAPEAGMSILSERDVTGELRRQSILAYSFGTPMDSGFVGFFL
jgi:hypothetical protein